MIETIVSFPADDLAFAGTLARPEGAGPFPALLLLQGSGPTDRDGNQPPGLITDLLKQIAHALAAAGVASLRFDKRGMYANARQMPTDGAALAAFYSVEGQLADSVAAWRCLATSDGIDPRRMGILGHSEGGLYALLAATESAVAGQVRCLALLAVPGRSARVILAEQIAALASRQGAPPDMVAGLVVAHERIADAIIRDGTLPTDIPLGLRALYPPYLVTYLRGWLPLDLSQMATRTNANVLVLQGDSDLQISADRDAHRLAAALRERADAASRLAVIPGASHNFKRSSGPADHAFAGPVMPEAMDALLGWVKQAL